MMFVLIYEVNLCTSGICASNNPRGKLFFPCLAQTAFEHSSLHVLNFELKILAERIKRIEYFGFEYV
jgi:hypothetical protein